MVYVSQRNFPSLPVSRLRFLVVAMQVSPSTPSTEEGCILLHSLLRSDAFRYYDGSQNVKIFDLAVENRTHDLALIIMKTAKIPIGEKRREISKTE